MKRTTSMAIHAYIDDDLAEQLDQARTQLLTDLSAGINATQIAAARLEQLLSNHLYDIELIDGRDGRRATSPPRSHAAPSWDTLRIRSPPWTCCRARPSSRPSMGCSAFAPWPARA